MEKKTNNEEEEKKNQTVKVKVEEEKITESDNEKEDCEKENLTLDEEKFITYSDDSDCSDGSDWFELALDTRQGSEGQCAYCGGSIPYTYQLCGKTFCWEERCDKEENN